VEVVFRSVNADNNRDNTLVAFGRHSCWVASRVFSVPALLSSNSRRTPLAWV
jgi:hypothetical protein